MSQPSSAAFWSLIDRWRVSDEQALELISYEGKLPTTGPQCSEERTHFCSSELTQRVRMDLWSVGETSRYPTTCLGATIPLFDCRNHSSAPTWVPQDMTSDGGQ
jgi:hypothetical protein